jgi:uncharacterized membrane protein (DUF485 family)
MDKSSPACSRETWLLYCLLFLVAFNFPFVLIFNRTLTVLGIPLLIAYLLVAWLLFILAIFLIVRQLDRLNETVTSDVDEGNPRA